MCKWALHVEESNLQVDDKKDDRHSGGHKGGSSGKGEGIVSGGRVDAAAVVEVAIERVEATKMVANIEVLVENKAQP